MDDDSGKSSVWNIPKHGWKRIDGQQHYDCCNDTGEWGAHACLGLDRGSREGTGRWVSSKERPETVGDANSHKFLRRVDDVVVDSAERFGDRDMLDEKNDHG